MEGIPPIITSVIIRGVTEIGPVIFDTEVYKTQTDDSYTISVISDTSLSFENIRQNIIPNMGYTLREELNILPIETDNGIIDNMGIIDLDIE